MLGLESGCPNRNLTIIIRNMGSQWIDAATARQIAADISDGTEYALAERQICNRAHAGIIKARAKLIQHQGKEEQNRPVPKGFWWAEGHEALEQDWVAGDFSTWIDQKFQIKAYGVEFALSGIMELLPIDRRGAVLTRYSVAGNASWISANKAIRLIAPAELRPARRAERQLIEVARLGFVAAKAVEARAATHGFDNWHWREREWSVPTWFWEHYTGYDTSTCSFELDTIRGYGKGPISSYMQLHGIHFLLSDLERHFSLQTASQAKVIALTAFEQAPRATSKGGRPPLAFNDEMICAIWALIYQGDLKPTRQSEVERAILDWASTNGQDLGETTARAKARVIFGALNREVKNPSRG